MEDEMKKILELLNFTNDNIMYCDVAELNVKQSHLLYDYITNLQEENKIKDTNWESLKYYLEKLYYKDYIEEAISDDIDRKIKELESKVEIKGYQKDIKTLQEENKMLSKECDTYMKISTKKQQRIDKAIEYIDNRCLDEYGYVGYGDDLNPKRLVNILKGEDNE